MSNFTLYTEAGKRIFVPHTNDRDQIRREVINRLHRHDRYDRFESPVPVTLAKGPWTPPEGGSGAGLGL